MLNQFIQSEILRILKEEISLSDIDSEYQFLIASAKIGALFENSKTDPGSKSLVFKEEGDNSCSHSLWQDQHGSDGYQEVPEGQS